MANPLISIRSMGLERYLNATAEEHNNKTYEDFVGYVDQEIRPSLTKIGEKFGVSYVTIGTWIKIYNEEQENK